MKKITLSALAAFAVVGTAIAGPTIVSSKEFKQPCVTPCFRDQEFQLDLFYSYNDASHQGNVSAQDTFIGAPTLTPVSPVAFPGINPLLTTTAVIPPGSGVLPSQEAKVRLPQYFNDGSGGGIGLNYFFARYFGVGVEGNWWDGCRGGFDGSFNTRDLVALSGPIDPVALAAAAKAANTSITVLNPTTLVLKTDGTFGDKHKSAAQQVTGSLILRYPFEGPICWAPYIFGGGGGIWDGKSTGFGHIGLGVEFRVTPYMGFFTDWRWEFMGGSSGDNGFDEGSLRTFAPVGTFVLVNGVPTVVTSSIRNSALSNLRNLEGNKRNDVNMTRVGVRFVF